MIRFFTKAFAFIISRFPNNGLINLLFQIVSYHVYSAPPKEGMIFLMLLDNKLYTLHGITAVNYGNGIHTKHRHTKYHDFFVDRVRQGEKVLDVGCGIGTVAYDIAERAKAEVVGIDLSAKNIDQAVEKFSHPKISYIKGDIYTDLPPNNFDVVVLSNILEHIKDRSSFLKMLQQLTLARRFLIRVPLFERDWRVPLKKELKLEWRLDKTHEIEYTIESFQREMDNASLRTLYQEIRWGEIWAEVTIDAP